MYPFPVQAKTLEQLKRQANPQDIKGQSEAVPWILYDTATYTSGADTDLSFFNVGRGSRRATNLSSPGQLPDPQFFEIYAWFANIIFDGGVTATAWDDAALLLLGNGSGGGDNGPPTWSFTLADKTIGPFPFLQLPSLGGVNGWGLSLADATAAPLEQGYSGQYGGCTAWWDGAVTIPPQQAFNVTLTWDSAVTLTAGDTLIQIAAAGVLHRRIV